KIPSALPAFDSGLRKATAVAPIGAVVGEWVGASSGLGYFMMHANARMQIDLMFAALFLLSVMSLILYFTIDRLLDRIIYWQKKEENPK
ncbi:MAG: ABC transporter permease subunit, partial [bacterium]